MGESRGFGLILNADSVFVGCDQSSKAGNYSTDEWDSHGEAFCNLRWIIIHSFLPRHKLVMGNVIYLKLLNEPTFFFFQTKRQQLR